MGERPFLGAEAVAVGRLTPYELRKDYVSIYRGVYVHRSVEPTLRVRTEAAVLWAGSPVTVVGLAAAALHGTKWIECDAAVELNRMERRSPRGIVVWSGRLSDDEICQASGLPASTPARTAFDIGRRLDADRAVEVLDSLMGATGVKAIDVCALADRHPGARGLAQMRGVLELVDAGAESPPETRTRLLLIRAGLPAPETQIELRDEYGHVYIRLDMGWRRWKVAVEYDGGHHWTDRRQRSRDIDRWADLEAAGWRVVRVSAELLAERPGVVVARVREAISRSSV
ncbi:endonuclease domain-containing protein [Williamsia soli]|uniref:endonuclease domain-containing protein n=1 Tax=Williamsia soli TaxID=364929 RepID=UPI001A9EE186|nr:DUF559 domain-containing protein [Williamsia soli]